MNKYERRNKSPMWKRISNNLYSLPQRVRQTFPLPRCGVNTVIFQKEGVKNMNFIVKKYDKLYLSQVMKASINTYK